MKTTIEWLKTLPEDIRDEAIANMRDYAPESENELVESLSSVIIQSLSWENPKWSELYTRTCKAENEAEMERAKKYESINTFDHNGWTIPSIANMSLRDWFAGLAMQSLAAGDVNQNLTSEAIAAYAYEQADAMLAARKELWC